MHKIEREAADIDVATEEHMKSYIKLRKVPVLLWFCLISLRWREQVLYIPAHSMLA